MPQPRDRATRTSDLLAALTAPAADAWVATASPEAAPYLVPLSVAWVSDRIVIAVEGASRTARNITASGVARVGVGPTRDVALIDAVLERSAGVDDDTELGAAYAAQADWDPRGLTGYVFLVLRPTRIQAWRESNELSGRVLMRDGEWLV
ncbi:pyridoxamine 5'-phosphate oxidase family protein [Microbacterium sp. M3]|uniref:Pyridoxamine 5'-phosphate oxidase family protein n=1 Tax=Microbacterium arthrosphaerae TaxID=792652 RepID=A0ABU4GZE0_9MICO|nr:MULTISPECIES: pyridoxamine 5'-phosphate oxidase family protein [Microbacterium]MDW4572446.1 pyridoxamine 5'-phosphate oxidase family protein [Microbacterium arthrosphaerae]MDW7606301.1 pyridoxamine 5'-phosphate oxidase family protein [Microbacterium sp. M3]